VIVFRKFKNREERAYDRSFEYEKNFGGCAQCVIAAIYDIFPEMKNEEVFRSASGLGAGVGLTTKGNCGGLTASVMMISQLYGRELKDLADPAVKRFVAYKLSQKLVQKFLDEYGTVTCADIQTKMMGRSFDLYTEWPEFLAAGGHLNACTSVVGNAAKWVAELIVEISRKGIDNVLAT